MLIDRLELSMTRTWNSGDQPNGLFSVKISTPTLRHNNKLLLFSKGWFPLGAA